MYKYKNFLSKNITKKEEDKKFRTQDGYRWNFDIKLNIKLLKCEQE